METIGAFEAKTRLSELLDRASRGESFVITKHGRPVAKLVPDGQRDSARVAAAVGRLRSFRGALRGLTVAQLLEDRDEGRRF
jgi:prevent-host-death family protein